MQDHIFVKGARVNNLKNIDVKKDKKTNSVTILTSFDMPEVQGQMDITYVVFANTGAVKVPFRYVDADAIHHGEEQLLRSWSYRELLRPQGLHAHRCLYR